MTRVFLGFGETGFGELGFGKMGHNILSRDFVAQLYRVTKSQV